MDFTGGSLKLKGSSSGISKKKKKSKKPTDLPPAALTSLTSSSSSQTKTEAELKFEEMQKKRQSDRIAKIASQSHKERVADFNKYLEGLSEHYDIPKVGPG